MKKNIRMAAMAALSLLFLATACTKGDVTKPTITLIEPEEGQLIQIGDDHGMHFEMDLEDDEALGSYKIDIHNNFDNHGHGKDTTTAFTFSKSYDLDHQRNAHIHHHDIVIPANATPGKYHLMVYCTDEAGNESHLARNIELSHNAPVDED